MAKKPNRSDATTKLWVRILCGVMGFLMIFGVLVMLFSALQSNAAPDNGIQSQPDQQISVGLYCNENAVQSYTLLTESGFQITDTASSLTVEFEGEALTAAVDGNLYRAGTQLSTQSVGIAAVGGYHIQITYFAFSDLGIDTDHDNPVFIRPGNQSVATDGYTPANVEDYIDLLATNSTFKALNLPAFPYYVSQEKCYIRVGSFYTADEAEAVLSQLQRSLNISGKVVAPDDNTLTFLSEDYSIFCEISAKGKSFNVLPVKEGILRDADGRSYSGNISLSRPDSAEGKGISVINRLSLEAYVVALLPSEVSSDWNSELLKTMAVVLRTEITRKLGCHKEDGFDICSDSHCHAYVGGATATDSVTRAVKDTAGQILTFEDKAIYTPYSLENGSGTISSADAFGKEIPYLPAVYTPWEEAEQWTREFTPYELYRLLTAAGYSEIKGNIESLQIVKRADGSDYVTSILFTDLFGTSVTISGSEAIRILFAGRLPSSCFVAGKAGDTVSYTKRTVSAADLTYSEESATVTLSGTYGSFVFTGSGSGCGVGLSIKGALALAERGMTYDEILSIYFPGTVLAGKIQ